MIDPHFRRSILTNLIKVPLSAQLLPKTSKTCFARRVAEYKQRTQQVYQPTTREQWQRGRLRSWRTPQCGIGLSWRRDEGVAKKHLDMPCNNNCWDIMRHPNRFGISSVSVENGQPFTVSNQSELLGCSTWEQLFNDISHNVYIHYSHYLYIHIIIYIYFISLFVSTNTVCKRIPRSIAESKSIPWVILLLVWDGPLWLYAHHGCLWKHHSIPYGTKCFPSSLCLKHILLSETTYEVYWFQDCFGGPGWYLMFLYTL